MITNNDDYLPEMVEAPKEVEVSASGATNEMSEEDRIKMVEKYDREADEISDEIDIYEEDIPKVNKKEILNKKDIFISIPSSKKNIKINNDDIKIIEDINDELEEDIPPKVKKVKEPKNKRVMSEEHKKKLAVAREKGLEARKRNAQLRKKAREEEKAEIELVKQVKHKRVQKLKKELEEEDKPVEKKVEIIEKEKIIEKGYTEEQLQSAIAKALYVEEEKRQVRKTEKKKKKAEEEQQAKIFNTVSKAVSPWDVCF